MIDCLNYRSKNAHPPMVEKFGKMYVSLDSAEVDGLCSWILEMREKIQGERDGSGMTAAVDLKVHSEGNDSGKMATVDLKIQGEESDSQKMVTIDLTGKLLCHYKILLY